MNYSNSQKIWFSSDLHVGHNNIIKYCNRPFQNVQEMNQYIIEQHNKVISNNDIVYNLGDFTFDDEVYAVNVLKQLNGTHRFIKGNHDNNWLYDTKKNNFDALGRIKNELSKQGSDPNKLEWIKDYYEFKHEGILFCLMHFPIMMWHHNYKGSIHVHGHSHGTINQINEEQKVRRLDVGVDSAKMILGEYRPFSIEEVKELMLKIEVKHKFNND